VLLRRTRASVLRELPVRTTDIIRIEPTDEQLELHSAHEQVQKLEAEGVVEKLELLKSQSAGKPALQ